MVEVDLELGRRREVGVPALGLAGDVVVTIPHQECLAEPGSRGDHRDVDALGGAALGEHNPGRRPEARAADGDRGQIVHQRNPRNLELPRQLSFVDDPRQVGHRGDPVHHRAGDSENG
jgi:hypothetical protein